MSADVSRLTRLIDNEVIRAMGLPIESWPGLYLHRILSRATRRFSQMFVEADQIIGERGLAAGARWLLLNLVDGFTARGVQNIPPDGPLVIASNHPGTVDSITLATAAGRDDLKILASEVGFLQNLPNVGKQLIFIPRLDTERRMLAVRESIRHLQQGGALLLFAGAGIDPDPAFMPHAEQELSRWSRSLEIFLRAVPQTRVIASIVSHVIEPRYMHHPITWLRRTRPDRQRLAMMIQLIQEMLGRKLDLVPRVSFGPLLDARSIGNTERALQSIIDSAKSVMRSHLAWQG
jgi:hypothetical protein